MKTSAQSNHEESCCKPLPDQRAMPSLPACLGSNGPGDRSAGEAESVPHSPFGAEKLPIEAGCGCARDQTLEAAASAPATRCAPRSVALQGFDLRTCRRAIRRCFGAKVDRRLRCG